MKELLKYILTSIVENPEDIKITEEKTVGSITLHFSVNPKDMSHVIGREGKVIRAIRNICKVKAVKDNIRFLLDLKEAS